MNNFIITNLKTEDEGVLCNTFQEASIVQITKKCAKTTYKKTKLQINIFYEHRYKIIQ